MCRDEDSEARQRSSAPYRAAGVEASVRISASRGDADEQAMMPLRILPVARFDDLPLGCQRGVTRPAANFLNRSVAVQIPSRA
jgi:hypothetical protein